MLSGLGFSSADIAKLIPTNTMVDSGQIEEVIRGALGLRYTGDNEADAAYTEEQKKLLGTMLTNSATKDEYAARLVEKVTLGAISNDNFIQIMSGDLNFVKNNNAFVTALQKTDRFNWQDT